ncbi:hypothetical protein B0A50_06964 [Salinomyces thailandicus]|uniref:RING-type domain-containing protein n=1 Tax=Salinomyces thailandicus TaxID=706561 RepID=A0A4V5N3J4_9PEZI|nr:hypothetical protein B0A50_06964 [Salinomyces thailandica]
MAGNNETPARCCIVCTGEQENNDGLTLIRPCRVCEAEYCQECVAEMFKGATTDASRMPPRCCVLLQIHTALPALTKQEANDYRAGFEEYLSPDKLYCPAPRCSAFISPRVIPPAPPSAPQPTTTSNMYGVLTDVLRKVTAHPAARFFRGDVDISQAPGYTAVVAKHIDLTGVQCHLARYGSTKELTADMRLIVTNARAYNGIDHPISRTAEELFDVYLQEISAYLDKLSVEKAALPACAKLFACPQCHVGICTKCKQIEHGDAVCDSSAQDYELAMLEQLRIRRCPNCKHAIRKMYGCSHIQCRCGAHFCYYCQRSVSACQGDCVEAYESEDEENDDLSDLSGEEPDEVHDEDRKEDNEVVVSAQSSARLRPRTTADPFPFVFAADRNAERRNPERPARSHPPPPQLQPSQPPAPRHPPHSSPTNLDAGGTRRWETSGLDFGDEPDEQEAYDNQIWSCPHDFEPYHQSTRRLGDFSELRMECNRCFTPVTRACGPSSAEGQLVLVKAKKGGGTLRLGLMDDEFTAQAPGVKGEEREGVAWECGGCFLVVCAGCRDFYGEQEAKGW